jgi:hypothetical protein
MMDTWYTGYYMASVDDALWDFPPLVGLGPLAEERGVVSTDLKI